MLYDTRHFTRRLPIKLLMFAQSKFAKHYSHSSLCTHSEDYGLLQCSGSNLTTAQRKLLALSCTTLKMQAPNNTCHACHKALQRQTPY